MGKQLLEGIRVLDITVHVTGPLTTKALGDLGAEIIHIDNPNRPGTRGDRATDAARLPHSYTSKLGITLNFANPKGLELARRIAAISDIVVENLAGGGLKRRGLGYDDLKKIKPDIIMLSSCMQGQTGPYYTHAASGHKLSAYSGFNQIAGWPDREPGYLGAYTDYIAPRYNVIAILAALEYRRKTGKGQYLDFSQNETGIQFMAPLILDYVVNKRIANRMGNQCSYAAPHNAYCCRGEDRWCAISIFTDEEWRSFCNVLGNTELASDPRFNTLMARKKNEEELDRLVNEWTITHTAEEVMALMQAAGVPAGIMETPEDQMEYDPQLKHRHFFWEFERPGGEEKYRSLTGCHCLLTKTPYELKNAPLVGEHNDYVYKGLLGMSNKEMAEMVKEGVI